MAASETSGEDTRTAGPPDGDDVVGAVLAAARIMVALSAQSVAEITESVTLPQLRVLVMVASRRAMNLQAVAAGLGVHSSNATRAVDRLAGQGLLARRDDPADRRNLVLELTAAGQELVDDVMRRRRRAIAEIVEQMSPDERRALGTGAAAFASAGGELPEAAVWEHGWPTG